MADTRSFIQKAFDQINVFDYGKSWGNAGRNTGGGGARPVTTPTSSGYDYSAEAAASNARTNALLGELRNLQAQVAQQPKLPYFDIASNWRRAMSTAESNVNPLYQRKMADFIARQTQLETRKRTETETGKTEVNTALQQALEDIATKRVRTDEDVTGALKSIDQQHTNYQTIEGMGFDQVKRSIEEGLAGAGLSTSGLGRQQVARSVTERNATNKGQLQEFQEKSDAQNTLRTRTFADLEVAGTRSTGGAETKKKALDVDLESYLQDLSYEKQQFTYSNEAERLGAILQSAQQEQKLGVDAFIASLVGSARPQDIALARQVYG